MGIVEKVKDLYAKRLLEMLTAQLQQQAGIMDYIAMMADVDIPVEEEQKDVV